MIREALPADLEAIVTLNEAVQALHVTGRPEMFRTAVREELTARFQQLFEDTAVKIWVSVDAGTVRGYLVGVIRTQLAGPYVLGRVWFELDQIGVAEGSRRVGVGRALIERGLAFAAEQGIPDVELNSWSFNEGAQRAFQKLGFVPKVVRFEHRK